MTDLTESEREVLDNGIRHWEDFGGPVLDAAIPAVERIIDARVTEAKREALRGIGGTAGRHALAARVRGDHDEERRWLDLCIVIERAVRIGGAS